MVDALLGVIAFVAAGGLVLLGRSVKQVQQFEEGIVFRFGRVLPHTRKPGLTFIRPIGDKIQKVNKQIVAMAVPAQEGISRDNISVRVDAVVYFKVVDPIKATINVQNYMFAVSQRAQTSLRSIIGQSEMDELLSERDRVNRQLCRIIDEVTEVPWGIKVESVEIKDVSLPEGMKRSIARQAEAERERRARIIVADAEYQASKRLAAAANVMARDPAALQLRLLQTVVEVASEKNSTLVMPVPVELLRFFEHAGGGSRPGGESPEAASKDAAEEVAETAAAIEGRSPTEIAQELAADDSLAIPPVPTIPDAPIPSAKVPEVPAEDALAPPVARAAGVPADGAPQDGGPAPAADPEADDGPGSK